MTPRDLVHLLSHHSLFNRFNGMRAIRSGRSGDTPQAASALNSLTPRWIHQPRCPTLRRIFIAADRPANASVRSANVGWLSPLSVECLSLETPRTIPSPPAKVCRMRTLPPGAEFVGEPQPTAGISRGNWRILPTLAFNYSPQGLSCAL